jgi:hypothetical protein
VHGGEGHIRGFEASLGSFFTFLPGWLRGFGAQGNVTYLSSEQILPEAYQLEDGNVGRIPGLSPWAYNVVAMYERPGWFSARLAFNHRTRWITGYFQGEDVEGFSGEYAAGVSRLDWSASYTPLPNLTFVLDWTNILGRPFRNFRQFTTEGDVYPRDVRYEESILSLGARLDI